MKILYIAHRIPYPPNKGDKIRSFNEIKYLSQRHEIHLACLADDPKDLKYENDLKYFCKSTNVVLVNPKIVKLKSSFYLFSKKPLSVPYFYSRKLQRTVDHLLSTIDFDIIFCFSSPMAEYVFKSRLLVSGFLRFEKSLVKGSPVASYQKLASSVQRPATSSQQPETSKKHPATSVRQPATKIMDFVDVDSDKWGQYSKHARFPMSWVYALEGRRLADYERKVAETFDHSIFVTEAEAKIFRNKNLHIKNITAISNGVDLDYFSPTVSQHPSTINQQPVIVFTGVMNYFANVDGVVWFTKEILPLIRKEIPEIRFYIVGRNPTKEVLSLALDSSVTVTGYVPDTREYLKMAAVVAAPLRIARGIQNKVLEAMAMGIPVVATPQAFEGVEAEPGRDLILGGDVRKIAEGVIGLVKEGSLRKSIGDNARRTIEKNYCWSKNLEKLDNVLME
jgi:sugar transferase (PEP-CTERM/EpsH1 system associated)